MEDLGTWGSFEYEEEEEEWEGVEACSGDDEIWGFATCPEIPSIPSWVWFGLVISVLQFFQPL